MLNILTGCQLLILYIGINQTQPIMKLLILTLCAVVAFAANPELDQEWQIWKKNNQKLYELEEEEFRRFVWEYNYKLVNEHNSRYALGHTSFTMAMNGFADMVSSHQCNVCRCRPIFCYFVTILFRLIIRTFPIVEIKHYFQITFCPALMCPNI